MGSLSYLSMEFVWRKQRIEQTVSFFVSFGFAQCEYALSAKSLLESAQCTKATLGCSEAPIMQNQNRMTLPTWFK